MTKSTGQASNANETTNPFNLLPKELLAAVFIDNIGEYLLTGLRTDELWRLLRVDKLFHSLVRRLRPRMAQAQVAQCSGIMDALLAQDLEASVKVAAVTANHRLFKNPYFNFLDLWGKMYDCVTIEDMGTLFHNTLPHLRYNKSPMTPKVLRGNDYMAFSCEHLRDDSKEKGCLEVLKAPDVVQAVGYAKHYQNPDTGLDVSCEVAQVESRKWDYAVLCRVKDLWLVKGEECAAHM